MKSLRGTDSEAKVVIAPLVIRNCNRIVGNDLFVTCQVRLFKVELDVPLAGCTQDLSRQSSQTDTAEILESDGTCDRRTLGDALIQLAETLIILLKSHPQQGETVFRCRILLGIGGEIGLQVVVASFPLQGSELAYEVSIGISEGIQFPLGALIVNLNLDELEGNGCVALVADGLAPQNY